MSGALLSPTRSPQMAGVRPVTSTEVVRAVAALAATPDLLTHLGEGDAALGAERLHSARVPLHGADGHEASSARIWGLVREMTPATPSGRSANLYGQTTLRLQVQFNLNDAGLSDPDAILDEAHGLAYEALEGGEMAVDGRFGCARRLQRTDEPSPPRYDDEGRLYSSAYYTLSVYPEAP